MKDKLTSEELRELLWKRPMTAAERAAAAGQPEWRADLELEERLTQALTLLPAIPAPSNFTSRVMQAVDREESQSRGPAWRWSWTGWLPRAAAMAAIVGLAVVSWQRHEVAMHRAALAQSVAQVADGSLPGVEALKNFEAIQRMGHAQPADDVLLALMQ